MKKMIIAAGLVTAFAVASQAALVHRYDFTTDATDSVGGADGTLYGSASVTNGGLYSGGNGVASSLSGGVPQNGAALDASAVAGISGSFTIECWYTAAYGGGYTTAFAFSDGTTGNYVLATPARGNAPYASSVSVIGGGTGLAEQQASGQYMDNNLLHHMLVTYNSFNGNLTYYQDTETDFGGFNTANGLSATISVPNLDLSSMTTIGINGGSPWPDNSMNGSVWDFRIHDGWVSSETASALYALGSDATDLEINAVVPEPATLGLMAFVGATVVFVRRRFSMQ